MFIRSPHGFRDSIGGIVDVVVGGSRGSDPTFKAVHGYSNAGQFILSRDDTTTIRGVAVGGDYFYTVGDRASSVTTRKYTRAGTEITSGSWPHDHGANLNAIAVDQSANVYVGGIRTSSVTNRKLNSDGSVAWSYDLFSGSNGIVRAIDVDQSGNSYVAGDFGGTPRVVKLNSSGSLTWTSDQTVNFSFAVAVDLSGNVYWGTSQQASPNRYTLHKLNSSGSIVWQATPSSSLAAGYACTEVAVGPSGDIYAVHIGNATVPQVLRRYDPSGSVVWEVDGTGIGALAVDADEYIYIGRPFGLFGEIAKLDPSDGSEIWVSSGTTPTSIPASMDAYPGRWGAFGS